jgi:cytochrome c5
MLQRVLFALLLTGSLVGYGCGDDDHHDGDGHADGGDDHHDDDGPEEGMPTGTTCPDGGTALTYDNFAGDFFDSYCTRCHSSELMGADRMGATVDHDFDTRNGAYFVSDHIDELAGSGPDATNRFMPPDGDEPTDAERAKLSEWIACGCPE